MTSSNGSIFRVTGGEFTGDRSLVNSPHKGQWRRALMFSLICAWANDWVNTPDAGDLGRHRSHHDVTVMMYAQIWTSLLMGARPWSRCNAWDVRPLRREFNGATGSVRSDLVSLSTKMALNPAFDFNFLSVDELQKKCLFLSHEKCHNNQ